LRSSFEVAENDQPLMTTSWDPKGRGYQLRIWKIYENLTTPKKQVEDGMFHHFFRVKQCCLHQLMVVEKS